MTAARGLVGRDERGSGTIRILQLEDSRLDAELEHDALAEGGIDCEIERVQTRSEFSAALQKGGFDLILADYALPGFDGLSALEIVRGVCPEVPFILISGTLGEEAAIETLKRGATDYVLKHRLERLAPAVRRAVREFEERTERERAEQVLRKSEAEYRAMFELAGVGKAQVDPHTGRFLRVNPKLCEITGYSAEEMLRLTPSEITHPEDRERDAEGLRSMISGRTSEYSAEQRYMRKDGTTIWVEVNTTLLRDEAGRPSRAVATIQDITHRKGAEEELVWLASFPDLNPDPILETTVGGEITYLNAAARERFPDLGALGLRHPVLEGLQAVEHEIRGGGRPVVREIQVDGSAYRQMIISVPERELLRFYTADTTEQHRVQEALRQSEKRFRSLVRYASDIIMILDADGTIVYESPAVELVLGFKPEERVGLAALDFMHPDDAGPVRSKLAELLEEPGRRLSVEYRVRDRAGSWHDFEAIAVNLLDDPIIRGVVVNTRDTTKRRRAEEALRQSEERFRLLAEKTNDLICLHEPDGRYVYVSPSSKRLLGYEPDELLGADTYALFHPDDAWRIRSEAHHRVHQGRGASITYRIRKKNGEYTWFETLTEPILNDDGNVVRLQTSSRDVSDRTRAEEALRQREQLYRSVVEQSVENIFIVDPEDKRILEANAALQRSLGLTADELQDMTLYDVVAHEPGSVDDNTRRIVERGHYSVGERKYRRKDGSLLDVDVNVSLVLYGGKEAMCIVAHDITQRNRSEEDLRRSLSTLLALREAGQVLGSTLRSEEVVSRLLKIMRGVAGLTAAVISRTREDGELRIWRSEGLEGLWPRIRFSPEAERARVEVLEDQQRRLLRLRSSEHSGNNGLVLYLPLKVRDRVAGILEAYGSESLAQDDTIEVLSSLSSQAASALENAQLYEELAERERMLQDLIGKLLGAQEEERRRVAYEVHDGLAQVAAAAHQHLQAFARRHPPEAEKGRNDLQRILKLVRGTVSDARRIIANLRPTTLDDLGLVATLSLEVERLREEGYGVDYEETAGEDRLPETVEIAFYRIAQEALTNMRKHARARRVRIELLREVEEVRLVVSDDGRGFDPAAPPLESGPGERVGLAGMRERIGALGGTLRVDSRPGGGTSVVANVPLALTR